MYLDKYKKWLLPVSVLFLLFFSSTTSPLTYNTVGTDSAFFQATGHYMNHGMLIYKDIFDIKGPLLFWIQAFAYAWKIPGRYILFFIQILNAWGCLVLADSIHLQISPKSNLIKRISSSLLFLFIWSFTMDGGNLTEEYCLIFLFLSLWTYLKYCNTQTCTFRYALLYGISFSAILLLKITNSGLVVCIVSLVFFECIYKRKWKDMKRLIIGFILGLFLVITPTLLYFYFNNSLYEMIDAAYLFAFKYAVEESIKLRFSLLLSMVFAMFLVVFREKNYRKIIFLLLSATIDTLLLCLGQGYIHYYQVLIPVFTYCYALLCKEKTKNYRLLLLTILFVLNLPSFVKHCGAEYVDIVQNTPKLEGTFWGNIADKATNFDSFSGNMHGYKGKAYVEDILVHMDKNQLDSVYNFSTRPNWIYYAKHLKLYNRYIQTPVFFIKCNPLIQEEIMSDLEFAPPFYIVTENNTDEENAKIAHWINSNYSLVYENELYQLHEKN